MLAAGLAVERGWAINMGGGMHHAFSSDGMGWCPFDDVMLAVKRLRKASNGAIKKVRIG
jgi:histone deacetylase 11